MLTMIKLTCSSEKNYLGLLDLKPTDYPLDTLVLCIHIHLLSLAGQLWN